MHYEKTAPFWCAVNRTPSFTDTWWAEDLPSLTHSEQKSFLLWCMVSRRLSLSEAWWISLSSLTHKEQKSFSRCVMKRRALFNMMSTILSFPDLLLPWTARLHAADHKSHNEAMQEGLRHDVTWHAMTRRNMPFYTVHHYCSTSWQPVPEAGGGWHKASVVGMVWSADPAVTDDPSPHGVRSAPQQLACNTASGKMST